MKNYGYVKEFITQKARIPSFLWNEILIFSIEFLAFRNENVLDSLLKKLCNLECKR